MINKTHILSGVIALTIPFAAFAAAPANNSGISGDLLKVISHQIQSANNVRTDAWNKYFQLKKTDQAPKNNTTFLSATSGYQKMANDYIFSVGNVTKAPQDSVVAIYCNNNSEAPFCQNPLQDQADSGLAMFNSQNVMDYAFQSNDHFQVNSNYIQKVISAGFSKPNMLNNQAQLVPASAIYNSLNQVMQSYQLPKSITSNVEGKQKMVQPPSQMQTIKAAINAPFQQQYFNSLEVATVPQTNRLIAELLAENNVLKYKAVRQNQTRTILESVIVSQLMKSNRLAKANLREMKVIAAELKQKQS